MFHDMLVAMICAPASHITYSPLGMPTPRSTRDETGRSPDTAYVPGPEVHELGKPAVHCGNAFIAVLEEALEVAQALSGNAPAFGKSRFCAETDKIPYTIIKLETVTEATIRL